MNSQFSYELDERQIRILMQSGELSFTETAWQRFDKCEKSISHSKAVKFVPNINLNFSINRSIVIPIFFVALIGGMSILLFSFVDFKKKTEVVVEKPLIIKEPVANKAVTPTVKPKPLPVKTITAPVTTHTQEQASTPATQQAAIDLKALENKAIEAKKNMEKTTTKPVEINTPAKPDNTTIAASDARHNKAVDKTKKKRRKRMTAEELPTINTSPASLSQNAEPELDLK